MGKYNTEETTVSGGIGTQYGLQMQNIHCLCNLDFITIHRHFATHIHCAFTHGMVKNVKQVQNTSESLTLNCNFL